MVTDSNNANKSAFRHREDIVWYPCYAHILNTVLTHAFTFKSTDEDMRVVSKIENLIIHSKELVTYCKRSGVNSSITPSLKQEVETRWDSVLETLESIQISFDQLKALSLENENLRHYFIPINETLLIEVIKLLKPFKSSREKLCRNDYPTFHEVAVIKQYLLMDVAKPFDSDIASIKAMKKRLSESLMSTYTVTEEHLIASYLTPGLKNNFLKKFHDQSLVKSARGKLKELYDAMPGEDRVFNPVPEKRKKTDDILSSYYTTSVVSAKHKSNELDRYSLFLVSDTDRDEDPIMFWNRNAKTFPKLSKIATNLIFYSSNQCQKRTKLQRCWTSGGG